MSKAPSIYIPFLFGKTMVGKTMRIARFLRHEKKCVVVEEESEIVNVEEVAQSQQEGQNEGEAQSLVTGDPMDVDEEVDYL